MYTTNNLAIFETDFKTEIFFDPIYANANKLDEEEVKILLVEDTYSDVLLTRISLEATKVPFSLSKIMRGDEVISRLSISQLCCPSEIPDLIMLDLGLPGMDGFEILAEMAQMPASVRSIPIVILTAHKHFGYVSKTYPLCVMAYLTKPCNSGELREILNRVKNLKNTIANSA